MFPNLVEQSHFKTFLNVVGDGHFKLSSVWWSTVNSKLFSILWSTVISKLFSIWWSTVISKMFPNRNQYSIWWNYFAKVISAGAIYILCYVCTWFWISFLWLRVLDRIGQKQRYKISLLYQVRLSQTKKTYRVHKVCLAEPYAQAWSWQSCLLHFKPVQKVL